MSHTRLSRVGLVGVLAFSLNAWATHPEPDPAPPPGSPKAAPEFTPFLSVDLDSDYVGVLTQPDWTSWELFSGYTSYAATHERTFTGSETSGKGDVTVRISPIGWLQGLQQLGPVITANGAFIDSDEFAEEYLDYMYSDFYHTQISSSVLAMGRHYIKIEFDMGQANAGTAYEVSLYTYNGIFNLAEPRSYQAWSTLTLLDGYDGPSEWMDENWDPDDDPETPAPARGYEPMYWTTGDGVPVPDDPFDHAPGGYRSPIPTLARTPTSGPIPMTANTTNGVDWDDEANPWRYAMISDFTTDENGVMTIYTWNDSDILSQFFDPYNGVCNWTILNGFQIAEVPDICYLGDTNGDLIVDVDDLLNVYIYFGEPGPGSLGDADCDGDTDVDDLLNVYIYFGTNYNPGGSFVPEPASAVLLAMGGAMLLARRRR